jgi:hypothetical protein
VTAATSTRAGALAAVLTAVVLALALAFSAQADVRAQRAGGAACTHAAAGHTGHVEHSCTDSGSTGRSHGKGGRSHTHSKSGHHPKHPTKRPAGEGDEGGESGESGEEAGESGETGAGEHASSAGTSETLCEDGSAPKAEGGGVFVCEEASAAA